jgi:enoyl-[acyl-carrier protein] reductase I
VAKDSQIDALFAELGKEWEGLDGLVHSIAFAPKEAIEGDFLDGISREAFRIAHDVSSYSYPALVKAARPLLLKGNNAAVLAIMMITVSFCLIGMSWNLRTLAAGLRNTT